MIVSLSDGNSRIELDENGNISGLDAPQFEKKIKSALATQKIEIASDAKELKAGTGVLMDNAEQGVSFVLSNPVGKVVQSQPPQFRWQPLDIIYWRFYDCRLEKVAVYLLNLLKSSLTSGNPGAELSLAGLLLASRFIRSSSIERFFISLN